MNRHGFLVTIVLLYAASFRLITLDRPFYNDVEGHGSFFGIQARNYLRFDWTRAHGVPLLNAGRDQRVPLVFYPDHPPFVPLSIAAAYAMFGVGEWQTRLPIALCTIATVWLLYRLLARTGMRRAGVLAAVLYAATPMSLYFGGLPDPLGMPLVLFVVLTVLTYLDFHSVPSRRASILFGAAFALAAVSDWFAFLVVPPLLLHFVATRPRGDWWRIVAFCASATTLFAALYLYVVLAAHAPWTWMAPLIYQHSVATAPPSISRWLATVVQRNRTVHTLPLMLAAGVWTFTEGIGLPAARSGATAARLVLGWGLLYVAVARGSAYLHDWTWALVTPGLAMAAGLLLDLLVAAGETRVPPRIVYASAVLLVTIFAASTTAAAYQKLYTSTTDAFTTVEMGQGIRAAAPNPDDVAMVVGAGWGWEPQWWFYGDRPLRVNVETIADFESRLFDTTTDLTYNFTEERAARATGLVFPTSARGRFGDLWSYLRQRYPLASLPVSLASKFDVFDLRRSR